MLPFGLGMMEKMKEKKKFEKDDNENEMRGGGKQLLVPWKKRIAFLKEVL